MRKSAILLSSLVVLFSLNGLAKERPPKIRQNEQTLRQIQPAEAKLELKAAEKSLNYGLIYSFKSRLFKVNDKHELTPYQGEAHIAYALSIGAAYFFPGKSHAARFNGDGFYPEGIVSQIVIDNPSAVFKDETNRRVFRIKNIRADVQLQYFEPSGQVQELFKISADKVYSAKLGNSVFYYIFRNSQNKLSAEFLDW